ncbi:MAG: rod shape-determining protein RodA [Bacteroidales bacterium]|nr:rod shape-determining protein RodA [Bacteroidales bacterium]
MSNYSNPYHKGVDVTLVILYLLLVVFGWMNIYAANFNPETKVFFSMDAEYFKQLMWVIVSFISIGIIMLVDSKLFVEIAYIIFGFSIVMLVIVLLIGKEVNGAKSWFSLGPISFQPVEFTKIGTALVVSRIMSRYGFLFDMKSYVRLFGILVIPIALVLLQNDTGSALIYFVFLLPMYREGMTTHILLIGVFCIICAIASLLSDSLIVMSVSLTICAIIIWHMFNKKGAGIDGLITLAIGIVVAAAFGAVVYLTGNPKLLPEYVPLASAGAMSIFAFFRSIFRRIPEVKTIIVYLWATIVISFATGYIFENVLIEHQRTRINILFGVEEDPLGAGYNVNQSLIAIGSGGLTGKGFLEGTQTKLNFVPKQSTDFIFCTVGEEWGFIGTTALIVVYLAFFIRIIMLAEKQHSVFSRVYGYCVASIFFFHFAVNICMTIGLMPVIGIPLPFFSYGGSSLWGFSMLLFIFIKLDTDRSELIR